MNEESLKNSILQLAIQGKLVEQREEEGTAEDLYKQIQLEKEKLIEEGKIRKQKKLPEIVEEEILFEIPETWKWVRLNEITYNFGQKKPEEIFHYIDVASIDNEKGLLSNQLNLIEPKNAPSRARKIVEEGTVLFSTVRPYLMNICVVDRFFEYESIVSTAFAVLHPFKGIDSKYLFYVLRSPMFIYYVNSKSTGATYPAINDKNLQKGTIPIPPLSEQKRIVERIEELMPYVERYGKAYEEVTELNKNFPTEMEKSILQYAIQGKLVEQREEEGTAEDLYKQIQLDKEKLIEAGEIKKQKKLPEITEEEIPFEIPETWKWVRLSEVAQINPRTIAQDENEASFMPMTLLGYGYTNEVEFEIRKWQEIKTGYTHFKENDILLAKITPSFENLKSAIARKLKNGIGAGTTEIYVLRPYGKVHLNYYLWFLKNPFFIYEASNQMTGTAGQKRVGRQVLSNYLFPLPPLTEQKRIVARIEELLEYTGKLKEE